MGGSYPSRWVVANPRLAAPRARCREGDPRNTRTGAKKSLRACLKTRCRIVGQASSLSGSAGFQPARSEVGTAGILPALLTGKMPVPLLKQALRILRCDSLLNLFPFASIRAVRGHLSTAPDLTGVWSERAAHRVCRHPKKKNGAGENPRRPCRSRFLGLTSCLSWPVPGAARWRWSARCGWRSCRGRLGSSGGGPPSSPCSRCWRSCAGRGWTRRGSRCRS